MSSTFWVKSWTSVGRSAKVTRKNSILPVRGLQQGHDSIPWTLDFCVHATAHVEEYADRDRRILLPEVFDRLGVLVLAQLEVLPLKSRDGTVRFIRHGHGYQHHFHGHANG